MEKENTKKEEPKKINEVEFLKTARDTYKTAWEAVSEQYDEMIEDLKFKQGDQWPEQIKSQREADGRPCLRINKGPQFVDKVTGDLRKSRPAIKIRPVDSKADPETADTIGGLLRNIEAQSEAETIYDSTVEAAATCGYGAARVITDYEHEESFDQVILFERIMNQFAVVFDPAAKKWDKSDGRFAFLIDDMPREEFKGKYPKADPCNFDASVKGLEDWLTEKTVRVAEYFKRETDIKTLYMIKFAGSEKTSITKVLPPDKIAGVDYEIVKQRPTTDDKIMWYRFTAKEILEGPVRVPGKYIPLSPCWGKETIVEGKPEYNGVIRHYKDPQRLYNYERSNQAEQGALMPIAPYIMTSKMLGPYKNWWDTAHKKSRPYLLFEPDPMFPGQMPQRNIPQISDQAALTRITIADQELHDTTGIQLASLGKRSNEQSGKAIQARAEEGDTGNFTYQDNEMRFVRHMTRIALSMVPEVYDTARIIRILGEDGTPSNKGINGETVTGQDKSFDLTVGKYDLVASTGPSYQTQRQEELAALIDFSGILSDQQRVLVSDLIAEAADWHNADRIAKRLKRTVPANILGPEDQEEQEPIQPNEAEIKAQALAETKMENELKLQLAELKKAKAEAAEAEASAAIKEAEAISRGVKLKKGDIEEGNAETRSA